MKFVSLPLFVGLCALALASCHSGTTQPHSVCHKLTTMINSYNHGAGTTNRYNTAQKALLTQQYKSLDCDDQ